MLHGSVRASARVTGSLYRLAFCELSTLPHAAKLVAVYDQSFGAGEIARWPGASGTALYLR